MEGNEDKTKKVIFCLFLCYFCSFALMVTSICTSSWYTTHPLAPTEQTSYGSVGLVEHCSTLKGVCTGREEVLKFTKKYWPYRPLKNQDFDVTLLLIIIAMTCTVMSLGLILLLRADSLREKHWLKWLLLLLSVKSAVLGITAVWYLDVNIRSEQFRRGWSSYVAWVAVGISILSNIPVFYLVRLISPSSSNVRVDKVVRADKGEKKQILSQNEKQWTHLDLKDYEYHDIHNVE